MTYCEIMLFDSIKVEENNCFDTDQKTILHSNSIYLILTKSLFVKKIFETSADQFLKPETEKSWLLRVVKDALK